MADGITGSTFDRMRVTPAYDSQIAWVGNNTNGILDIGNGMATTANGLNILIDTGVAMVGGRRIEITEPITLSAAPNVTSGYVCLVIDLTKQNTSTGTPGQDDYMPINNQVSVQLVSEVIKQDIWNDGSIYMFAIARYKSNTTNVTLGSPLETLIPMELLAGPLFDLTGARLVLRNGFWSIRGYATPTQDIPARTKALLVDLSKAPQHFTHTTGANQFMPFDYSTQFLLSSTWLTIRCSLSYGDTGIVIDWAERDGVAVKIAKGTQIPLGGYSWDARPSQFIYPHAKEWDE